MTKAVFGLANNDEQANRIVDHLLSSGFSNSDISILYPDRNKNAHSNDRGQAEGWKNDNKKNHVNIEKNTKAPEGAATGATAGGILGGSLGLLAGIGALAIPGLGPFIAAGPIMAALSGSAVGGSLGLLIGALVGSGIPEHEAKAYEKGLKEGNILISVHADNDQEIHRAYDIFKREGAKDISTSQEKTRSY
ncbi:MAG: hypothetical protein Q8K60_02855 [Parachlamydiaceae bacterium]|nr:hypothetical protein [Parachlamydiaceae bacterium]